MKIEPPLPSDMPDFSEDNDPQSGQRGNGSHQQKENCKPMVPHETHSPEVSKDLKSRKASKRGEKSKRRRKIAERKARQEQPDDE